METNKSAVLKAVADDTRLRVINLLISSGVPLCVCEIVDALGLPQYQISKHLSILKQAGLIRVERDGTWAYHAPDEKGPSNKILFAFLKQYLAAAVFEDDRLRLKLRLSLRENGRCVVGFVSQPERRETRRKMKNLPTPG